MGAMATVTRTKHARLSCFLKPEEQLWQPLTALKEGQGFCSPNEVWMHDLSEGQYVSQMLGGSSFMQAYIRSLITRQTTDPAHLDGTALIIYSVRKYLNADLMEKCIDWLSRQSRPISENVYGTMLCLPRERP